MISSKHTVPIVLTIVLAIFTIGICMFARMHGLN